MLGASIILQGVVNKMTLSADIIFIIGCFVLNEYYFAYILLYFYYSINNLPLYIDSTAFQPLAFGRTRDMMKLGNERHVFIPIVYTLDCLRHGHNFHI